jgi:hypothetical protein
MDIDFKSARMNVDIAGSAPNTDISDDGQSAVLHLTRNADPIIAKNKRASDSQISAINISGSVDVRHGAKEDVSKSAEFHFIQLAAHMCAYVSYAGRTSRDGAVELNFAQPPAYPQKFAFDFVLDGPDFAPGAPTDVLPFTNDRATVILPKRNNKGDLVPGVSTMVAETDDHPALTLPLAFQNRETKRANFLVEVIRDTLFVTAFVVREKRTKITILAHVCWRTFWSTRYHWVAGKCVPYKPEVGAFDVGKTVIGAATGEGTPFGFSSAMADKITKPNTNPKETANELSRIALKNLEAHPLWWNLSYLKKWPVDLPPDFWRN